MSEYTSNWMHERLTTFGAAKQQMEIVIGFLSNYKADFPASAFEETVAHLKKGLESWAKLGLPTKERWR